MPLEHVVGIQEGAGHIAGSVPGRTAGAPPSHRPGFDGVALLRRQRSYVRIVSGAPVISTSWTTLTSLIDKNDGERHACNARSRQEGDDRQGEHHDRMIDKLRASHLGSVNRGTEVDLARAAGFNRTWCRADSSARRACPRHDQAWTDWLRDVRAGEGADDYRRQHRAGQRSRPPCLPMKS